MNCNINCAFIPTYNYIYSKILTIVFRAKNVLGMAGCKRREQKETDPTEEKANAGEEAEEALTVRQLYELGFKILAIASAGVVMAQVLDILEPEYDIDPELYAASYYSATYVLLLSCKLLQGNI